MSDKKVKLSDYPRTFWVANTMEIFERMAWYGFFAVSSLYISGSIESGGLGFSDEDRGVLQGIVTFFLYLFPVVTGALADRYGFKKMLFASFCVLVPAYFFLGQFHSFGGFFMSFMMVALGAAMFKPVIIGTIAKVTDERTSSMGFGIFYMMVNIGGFMGPIIAGVMRAMSWNYVFIASAAWIAINFIFVTIFYKEPTDESASKNPRSLKKVMNDMVLVLGNGRMFLFVFGLISILVMGSKFTSNGALSWADIVFTLVIWTAINVIYDFLIADRSENPDVKWFKDKMRIGDWKFGLFLLLMSGFWASFNQIFYTLPLHIRDFTDTSDLYGLVTGALEFIGLEGWVPTLRSAMVTPGQLNPEYIININAGAIIFFQVAISSFVARWKPFTTIFYGVIVTIISSAILIFGTSGFVIAAGLLVFSVGEMMASPKSKEYTGRIAPPDKVALYMGYFYWCVALGNLFGGILSGQFYAIFARDMQRPDIMWFAFVILGVVTAAAIWLYDKFVIKRPQKAE